MWAERRCHPLLAVVLTATLVCLSVWRLSTPPCCEPPPPSPSYLLLNPSDSPADPYPRSGLGPGDQTSLIDLQDFNFLMNDPICNASTADPPLFVVLVHTAPTHESNRRAIRTTWGRGVKVVFLLGETNSSDVQEALEQENSIHHDLVQANFRDSYRNLTYKHVLGLKWVTYHCPEARYVVKIDDDVFVNTPYLREFLTKDLSPAGARRLVMCDVVSSAIVKRSYRSKWRVSHLEYRDRWYPDYCYGWAILYSPDAVFRLYREAQRSEFFWVDDVHVTGTLLQRVNLTHTPVGNLSVQEEKMLQMMETGEIGDFLFSLLPTEHFRELWALVSARANAATTLSLARTEQEER